MHVQLIKMEQAVRMYKDKRDREEEGYSFDIHEFMKATTIAVRRMNKAVLDLQLKQCGTCSWKKQYLDTLKELSMGDLLIIQSKINEELTKKIEEGWRSIL